MRRPWLHEWGATYLADEDGTSVELDPFDVYLDWHGRLTRRTSNPLSGTTLYEFGRGRVTIDFTWLDPVLGAQTGAFRGRLEPFAIGLVDADDYGPQVNGPTGRGRLDANLAQFLGVGRRAEVTGIEFLMDDVFDAPGDTWRSRGGCCQYLDLAFTPASVPEPSDLSVLLTAAAWGMTRRRRTAP